MRFSGERKLQDDERDYLGPVAIAQFVDLGWLKHWPMTWSRAGRIAIGKGYGRWAGTDQHLPIECEQTGGAASWPGRRATIGA